jgi:hypothetical protein
MASILTISPTKAPGNRKFSDERLIELHSQGFSIPKMAMQLGVSQQPVRDRMKKLGLKANWNRGGVTRYEKVGSDAFRCSACRKVKPLRQRNGTKCHKCTSEKTVSTKKGALRYRYIMKKSVAQRKGIPFNLKLEDFERLYEEQAGKDGYTGQQMAFDFGQGRSGATVTLDRIDNEKGYTPFNVMFCRLATNSKKGNRPVGRLIEQLEFDFSKSS